jgi:hypothetical protein
LLKGEICVLFFSNVCYSSILFQDFKCWYGHVTYVFIAYICNIRTLSVNIKFICTRFRNRQNSELFRPVSQRVQMNFIFNDNVRILCLSCNVKKSENLSDLNKKDRNKRHSSPFINVVKGVFFVVRVTLVPVSYLSAPSAVHSYRVPGKFIRIVRKVYSSSTNTAYLYSKCIDCRIKYFKW